MKHPADVGIIASAIWLLASEVIDVLTPKAVTGVMIAEALAPPVLVGVLLYALRWHRNKRHSL